MAKTFNLTADGSTPSQGGTPSEYRVTMVATGTFGGGAIDIEVSVDGTNWAALVALPLTSTSAESFFVHPDLQYRATLSGATAPDIDITFVQGPA